MTLDDLCRRAEQAGIDDPNLLGILVDAHNNDTTVQWRHRAQPLVATGLLEETDRGSQHPDRAWYRIAEEA